MRRVWPHSTWVTAPLEENLKLGRLQVSTRLLVTCPSSPLERDYSLPWKVSQCLWHMVEGVSSFIALECKQISFRKKRKIYCPGISPGRERVSISLPIQLFLNKTWQCAFLGRSRPYKNPRNPGMIISQQTFVKMMMSQDGRNLDLFQSPDGGEPLLTHMRLYVSKK